jgi:hypothetical protein
MPGTNLESIEGVKELHPLDPRITVDIKQVDNCSDFIQSRIEESELNK